MIGLHKNKKGQAFEFLTVLIILFATSLFLLGVWVMGDQFSEGLRDAGLNDTAFTDNAIDQLETNSKAGDTIVGLAIFGLSLLLIILSALLPTTPIMMGIFILFGVIFMIVAPILSNVWEAATGVGELSGAASAMPLTNTLMLNLPRFATILFMIQILVLFGKRFILQSGT